MYSAGVWLPWQSVCLFVAEWVSGHVTLSAGTLLLGQLARSAFAFVFLSALGALSAGGGTATSAFNSVWSFSAIPNAGKRNKIKK